MLKLLAFSIRALFIAGEILALLVISPRDSAAATSPPNGISTTSFGPLIASGAEGNVLLRYDELYLRRRGFPGLTINQSKRIYGVDLRDSSRLLQERSGAQFSLQAGLPIANSSPFATWISTGPTNINGRVTSIAVDSRNAQRIFIATVGGIWRSIDRGRSWQRTSDEFLPSIAGSVAIAPDNGEVLVGTGDPQYYGNHAGTGIWRSLTGDTGSWTKVSADNADLDASVVFRLIYDPDRIHVYAATSAGVFIGTRGTSSISWTLLDKFDSVSPDLAIDFSKPTRIVYAASLGGLAYAPGVWKYDGKNWNERDSGMGINNPEKISLAIAPTNPTILYAKVTDATGALQGIYRTNTAAETRDDHTDAWSIVPGWQTVGDSHCCTPDFEYDWYNSVLSVSPSNSDTVFAGGLELYRTTDGGAHWQSVSTGADGSYPLVIHPDQHAIAFDPSNPGIVYVGNDGGIVRSTDAARSAWHWENISHGVVITEFYKTAVQESMASLVAGGSQDNGTEITFGNRTWYNPGGCDGADVGIDSGDSDTLFSNCNGQLSEISEPVPGLDAFPDLIQWQVPDQTSVVPPLISDLSVAHATLAGGIFGKTFDLLSTSNGIAWDSTESLPEPLTFIASAPSAGFKIFYVGVASQNGAQFSSTVYSNASGEWIAAQSGLPRPNIDMLMASGGAVDYAEPKRAFVAFSGKAGGNVYMTSDGGASWVDLRGSGDSALPNRPVLGVAIDPFNNNRIYAATSHGVYTGLVSGNGTQSASWESFSQGLPDGVDVNSIVVNRAAGLLNIGTAGHGAFLRDVNPAHIPEQVMLVVRDNVFDRGIVPSPSGLPNPEYPIPDVTRAGFYKPNDTPGGQLYWWTSPDIRIDVPAIDPPANRISDADSVEMQSCPLTVSACPPGTIIDSSPQRGSQANLYVQATNNGAAPATNVRVIALYADAPADVPDLPATFWSKTFPKGAACGSLDGTTWHLVDPIHPCRYTPIVSQEYPRTVRFQWKVPATLGQHTAILVMIESNEDQIANATRMQNERRVWKLVPNDRHIAIRNVQVIDTVPTPHSFDELIDSHWQSSPLNVLLSTSSNANISVYVRNERAIAFSGFREKPSWPGALPVGLTNAYALHVNNLSALTQGAASDQVRLDRAKINLSHRLELTGLSGSLEYFAAPEQDLLLNIKAGGNNLNGAAIIQTVIKRNGQVVGGTTYIVRPHLR